MRKVFAILIMIVGVPMLMGSLFLVSVGSWATDTGFYKAVITDPELYAFIKTGEYSTNESADITINDLRFNSKAFLKAFGAAFPEKEIKTFSIAQIDGFFADFQSGKLQKAGREIDFKPLKSAFMGKIDIFTDVYFQTLPVDATRKAETGLDFLSRRDLTAIPANIKPGEIRSGFKALIAAEITSIPDSFQTQSLESSTAENGISKKGDVVAMMNWGARGLYFPLVASGILWLVAGLLFSTAWDERSVFMGTTLGFASIIILGIGIATKVSVNLPALANMLDIPALNGWVQAQTGTHLATFFSHIAEKISTGFFITGLVSMSLAVGVTSLKWIASRREI